MKSFTWQILCIKRSNMRTKRFLLILYSLIYCDPIWRYEWRPVGYKTTQTLCRIYSPINTWCCSTSEPRKIALNSKPWFLPWSRRNHGTILLKVCQYKLNQKYWFTWNKRKFLPKKNLQCLIKSLKINK